MTVKGQQIKPRLLPIVQSPMLLVLHTQHPDCLTSNRLLLLWMAGQFYILVLS